MCETSLEESKMFDNEVCESLDATMVVVADFASMLANGNYHWLFQKYLFLHFPILIVEPGVS